MGKKVSAEDEGDARSGVLEVLRDEPVDGLSRGRVAKFPDQAG